MLLWGVAGQEESRHPLVLALGLGFDSHISPRVSWYLARCTFTIPLYRKKAETVPR